MSSIRALIKRIESYGVHCYTKFYKRFRFWRDAERFRGSRDLFTVLGDTKRFVKMKVPELLDLPADTPVHIELPPLGSQSLTVILTAAEKKAVLRVYPLCMQAGAEAHINATRLLTSHGVNVPRILFSSLDAPRGQVVFILEEFIEGELRRASDITNEQIAHLASQLAKMHSVHSSSWGRLNLEREAPFFPSMMQRVKRDLKTLGQRDVLNDNQTNKLLHWAEQWEPNFRNYQVYSLTHNDLQPSNGLFTADNKYYLVDVNRLQWGPAAREVVQCYYRQLRNDPAKIAVFDEAYYAGLDPEHVKPTREFCRFYEVFHRITALVKMDVKAERIPELQARNTNRQKIMVAELDQLVNAAPPAAG